MRKISFIFLGIMSWLNCLTVFAVEKFDILPDLPEPLAAAQASSVTTTVQPNGIETTAAQSIGHEPSLFSVAFSLIFVILLIYATGIIYAKLNRFGGKTLRNQLNDLDKSKISVVSSTPLGGNRTLHVVELDGNRMLIGASPNSVQLIKELGSTPSLEIKDGEYSKIEIPNIRIPKIEIPKIEFPGFGFTKASSDSKEEIKDDVNTENIPESTKDEDREESDDFEISDIYQEGPDGIIDKLFQTSTEGKVDETSNEQVEHNEHKVDPDEYALYKKYL